MKRFVKITAFCDTGLKVVDYPFDQHNCDIRFGSYDMDNTQLILAIDKWNDFRQIEPSNDRLVEIWDSIKDDSRTVDFSESRGNGYVAREIVSTLKYDDSPYDSFSWLILYDSFLGPKRNRITRVEYD